MKRYFVSNCANIVFIYYVIHSILLQMLPSRGSEGKQFDPRERHSVDLRRTLRFAGTFSCVNEVHLDSRPQLPMLHSLLNPPTTVCDLVSELIIFRFVSFHVLFITGMNCRTEDGVAKELTVISLCTFLFPATYLHEQLCIVIPSGVVLLSAKVSYISRM